MERTKTKYEKLSETIIIKGTGLPNLSATLLERTAKKAIYKRADNIYECFYIKTQEACEIFDKKYPAKEIYPNNEDFGKIAWCFNSYRNAMNTYNRL